MKNNAKKFKIINRKIKLKKIPTKNKKKKI